jgi:hypothetical protein
VAASGERAEGAGAARTDGSVEPKAARTEGRGSGAAGGGERACGVDKARADGAAAAAAGGCGS